MILISLALGLLWLDLNYSVRGQHGVWTLPLLGGLALGPYGSFPFLLRLRWSVSPAITIFHSAIALLVGLFPVWYGLIQQSPYPTDCPVGRLGWILIGIFTGIGLSGVHALREFGKAGHAGDSEVNQKETQLNEPFWLG